MQYRREFSNESTLEGVELKGRRVLDAMCGAGQLTDYLLTTGDGRRASRSGNGGSGKSRCGLNPD